jgi:glycosyltransferase involved in cell wall biosynthesis
MTAVGDENGSEATAAGSAVLSGMLSVILPAHNEELNLEPVARRALEVLPGCTETFELLIVDDGSTDRTGAVADALAAEDKRVRVIHHARNRGYGNAWRSGIAASAGDWIFFMDSDRQFDIKEITKLIPLAGEFDVVTGYRIKRMDPQHRYLIGTCFNLLITALFDVHLKDIDCGFKMFRASLLKELQLEMPGALINTEIHAKINRLHARVVEVGIDHYPRPAGRQSGTKPSVMFRACWEIVALWFKMRRQPKAGVEAAS